ncbi:Mitochondrial GTPase [Tulasnella sp. 403]|nr:Mitochondrial GTPase [Tulasnella sp. 403]
MPTVEPPARVLVTGANGFTGCHIVQALLNHGFSVRGTVRSTSKAEYLITKFALYGPRFECVVVPDMNAKVDNPNELILKPAVEGIVSLLESARKYGPGIKRVVVTSSTGAVMEPKDKPYVYTEADWNESALKAVKEGGSNDPFTVYCATKLLIERTAMEYAERNKSRINFDVVRLVPASIFGPPIHQIDSLEAITLGSPLILYVKLARKSLKGLSPAGFDASAHNMTDVRDVAELHVLGLRTDEVGGERLFIIGHHYNWRDAYAAINDADPQLPGTPVGLSVSSMEDSVPMKLYSGAKAKRIFKDFEYRVPAETMRDTWTEFIRRGWTHVVLEVRDIRLPLTSINPTLEAALAQWKKGEGKASSPIRERIVVYTKKDLVDGGEQALKRALSKHFDHRTHFNSKAEPGDLRNLHSQLVSIARDNSETTPILNVLVVGMPNMGKSTLLNSLRWAGTANSTKALRTSALPGLTQKTSERLKLNLDPPIYAVDSPGVMAPYLGSGEEGRERALKLALIAGIKESLHDDETLAAYLLYKLNRLNPSGPAYLSILPTGAPQSPIRSIEPFLELLSRRIGARLKGDEPDIQRTAKWFIKWWREGGAKSWPMTHGWGFDFDFLTNGTYAEANGGRVGEEALEEGTLEAKIDRHVARFAEGMKTWGDDVSGAFGTSPTREKHVAKVERKRARDMKRRRQSLKAAPP